MPIYFQLKSKKLQVYIRAYQDIKVIKFYDGDTITVSAKVLGDPSGETYHKWRDRLRGIDVLEKTGIIAVPKQATIIAKYN